MTLARFGQITVITAATVVALTTTPTFAQMAERFDYLNGLNAGEAEASLSNQGYKFISSHRDSRGYTNSYWWNGQNDTCLGVEVYIRSNRVESVRDATDQDCGHHKASGAAAAGAVLGAAILGSLLSHKSHHKEGKDYNQTQTVEFDRGYLDGLHNSQYRNSNRSDAYEHGYEKGADERNANLSRYQGRRASTPQCPTELNGNECDYYLDGYRAGSQDGAAGMSMAYERHDGFDSRFEPYFARGYEDGWRQTR